MEAPCVWGEHMIQGPCAPAKPGAPRTAAAVRHSLCGKLWADSFEEEQQWIGGDTGVLEVILLFETGFFATGLRTEKEFAPSQGSTPPAYSSKCYYVMVLKRGDNGTDERIGIGLVMAEAVPRSLAPGPVWKEVLLA